MKLASGRAKNTGRNSSAIPAFRARDRQGDYLEIFLVILMGVAALLAFSMLLPDEIAQKAQELIGWGSAGAMALLALLVAVRVLEGFFDE